MRTSRLFLGIFALALLMPLLLACGGSDEPTDRPSSERATAEPTDMPDPERPTDEPETPASPARTPSTPGSGDAPTATDAPAGCDTPPAATGSGKMDREALVALYNATDGENWDVSDNWLSDAPLGLWASVTTDDDGRVTELALDGNNLIGKLPPELGSLSNLKELDLRGSGSRARQYLGDKDLVGEIPAELGSLFNLNSLSLRDNELSGCVPSSLGRPVVGLG